MLSGLDPLRLAEFALASLLIELTPGPNMVWLAVVSATQGRRFGLAAVAGVATGLSLIGMAAALGVAALVAASPVLWDLLRWAGVAWLLYLAYDAWRDADAPPERLTDSAWFRRGLLTNLLNPKAALFYVAVLPGFTATSALVLGQTLILTLTYVVIATSVHLAIVVAAGTARRLLEHPVRGRIIRRALAVLLALVALWFLVETARQ